MQMVRNDCPFFCPMSSSLRHSPLAVHPALALLLAAVALLSLLLGSGCAHNPQADTPVDTQPVSATAEPKTETPERRLSSNAFTTIQYEAPDFYYHSPSSFPPLFQEQQTVFSGQSVLLAIVTKGFALSEDSEADITCEMTVIEPDGTEHQSPAAIALYQGRVRSPNAALFPRRMPMLYFGEDEPTGLYTIALTVTDNISGQQQQLERKIRVRSYRPPALPEGFDPIEWMENYYLHPTPELALPALQLLGTLTQRTWPPHLQNDYTNAQSRMIGFYDRLLADNPWLLPHFAEAHTRALYLPDDHPHNLRPQIEMILRTHFRRFNQRPEGVPQRLWSQSRNAQYLSFGNEEPGVHDATARERLWGQFFASGSFLPIYTLATASTLYPDMDDNARRIQATLLRLERNGQPALLPPGALNSLDRNSQSLIYTLWSLHEQAQKHPLVRAYLLNIIQNGNIDTFDDRAIDLLTSLQSPQSLRNAGVPPINTTPDLSYFALQENHDLLRDSHDHFDDLRSEDPDLRTEQLIRLDELAEANAKAHARWQTQILRPHRIVTPASSASTTSAAQRTAN